MYVWCGKTDNVGLELTGEVLFCPGCTAICAISFSWYHHAGAIRHGWFSDACSWEYVDTSTEIPFCWGAMERKLPECNQTFPDVSFHSPNRSAKKKKKFPAPRTPSGIAKLRRCRIRWRIWKNMSFHSPLNTHKQTPHWLPWPERVGSVRLKMLPCTNWNSFKCAKGMLQKTSVELLSQKF